MKLNNMEAFIAESVHELMFKHQMDMHNSPLAMSFIMVLLTCTAIALPVICGIFDSAAVETGLEHYAEKPYWGLDHVFPAWMPLPANTTVNIGYVIIGMYWIWRIRKEEIIKKNNHSSTEGDAYFFYMFSWMSIFYGLVQSLRIVGQYHRAAILDQWVTLPIFSWVTVWSIHIIYGWNPWITFVVEALAIFSYISALLWTQGFEVALCVQIVTVICSAMIVYRRYATERSCKAFFYAIACCFCFVVLKLLDHELARLLPGVFVYLSGHFWSKIADFMQIHYTCLFFLYTPKPALDKDK